MDKYSIALNENLFSDRAEKDYEFSVSLPEYCPNCVRVVRCETVPIITEKSYNDGEIYVGGKLNTKILYVSDYRDKLKGITVSEDFSCTFKTKRAVDSENPQIYVSAESVYCTAKIASARRIDVKNRTAFAVSLSDSRIKELYNPEKDAERGVFALEEQSEVCDGYGIEPRGMSFESDINLEAGEKTVAELLYTACSGIIEKTACADGRADYSGYMDVRCVYEAQGDKENDEESGGYETLVKRLALSGSIEDENIKEGQRAVLELSVCSADAGISYDPYGENRIVTLNIPYTVSGKVYDCHTVTLCTDAFGAENKCSVKVGAQNAERLAEFIDEKASVSERLHADMRQFSRIIDAGASMHITGTEFSEGKTYADGRVTVNLLGLGDNGAVNSAEYSFNTRIPISSGAERGAQSHYELVSHVDKAEFSAHNGELVCDVSVSVSGARLEKLKLNAVESVEIGEPLDGGNSKARIVIYYPDGDETVWSIAKTYAVSPQKLREVNSLSGDTASGKKIIVIPRFS